jgi:predicted Zn-dependent protease
VLRNYRLNAFSLPNGALYVHTGLLARMESEAELAVLLGHELVHATHRHAVRGQRSASNWSGAMAGVSAATLGLSAPLGNLARGAAVSGHSRDLEREADREGLALAAAAGYDVGAAPALFQHLAEWVEEEGEEQPFFFGSHPRLEERRESCAALLAERFPERKGIRNEDAYRRRVSRLLLTNARLALDAGRYRSARRDAERHLALEPRSAAGHATLGEAGRRSGDPAALAAAAAEFRAALALDPGLAEAHRGLGLALHKQGDRPGARAALRRYLQLAPRAPDAAHVKAILDRPGDST